MTDEAPVKADIQVYRFIVEGFSNTDILEYLEQNDMTLEDAKRTFEEALKKFIKASKLPKEVRRGWCFEAYRDLYRRLLATGDYAGALRAVKEIANLSDITPKKGSKDKTDPGELKDDIDNYIDSVMALE